MIRIVAGRYGSRRIETPSGSATRPTSDRVREAIFSAVGTIENRAVLDLFAGSGALGFESLSRGAASAVFVDSSRSAQECLSRNAELLELGAECRIVRSDWKRALDELAEGGARFDLIFVDPPYADSSSVAAELPARLAPVLRHGAMVVVESGPDAPLVEGLPLAREKRYGDTVVRLYVSD